MSSTLLSERLEQQQQTGRTIESPGQMLGQTIKAKSVHGVPTDTLNDSTKQQLQKQAEQIVDAICAYVETNPQSALKYYVWNVLKERQHNDPRANYILDMVRSRQEPLQHFFTSQVRSIFSELGDTFGGGSQPGGSGGSGGSGNGGGSY